MMLLWWILPPLVFALLPLQIRLDLLRGRERLLTVALTYCGFTGRWTIRAHATPRGHVFILTGQDGRIRRFTAPQQRRQQARSLARRLWQCRTARRYLLRRLHPRQLDAQLQLHSPSPASTALAACSLQTLLRALPPRWLRIARIRILPDFISGHSTLQARCIFRILPGTLIVTAGLLLAQAAWQAINREAQRIWNTPSEN